HLKDDVATSGRTVEAIADVANDFDSVPPELVFAVHRSVISERVERYFYRLELHDCYNPQTAAMYIAAESETEGLLELVDWALTASPPEVMHGIDQGGPYSPTAMNALLHFLHDVAIDGLPCLSGWYRYADNLVYLFKNAAEGE